MGRDGLVWRSWDPEQSIVYHCDSGDTHLVNSVTAEVLRVLERSPCTASRIARTIAPRLGVGPDEGLARQVRELLEHLDRVGLAEPVG
ncbi:MAG TPA: HPr-rel-A system PqqD family peptide chaperone [Candidatus Polarisedimenticolaceae bacterium]|nr:HPr-rel-A system PqqD family peptide chaperone [Candidatus Polarisedimenticolaceae bacterium]